ncbi:MULTISPECIES: STAS domain-containing protein [unclassified Streptomyces]|uniref:STAS domain-containing protein n=1 Tax=unclassified Streptomyces TaxID=2593676 RepID=UPI0036ED3A44
MAENQSRHTPRSTERVIGGTTVVELRGEIDILEAPPLSARLDTLTAGPCPDLLLDLRPVSFIDCSGLRVLCRVRNRVLTRHGRLRLVSDSHRFARILRSTFLTNVFEIHSDLPPDLVSLPVEHVTAAMVTSPSQGTGHSSGSVMSSTACGARRGVAAPSGP